MRFRIRSLFLFRGLIALLLGIAFPLRPTDGYIGSLILLFEDDGTVWADGYSESGFKSVRIGMARSEVYKLLGPPLTGNNYFDGTVGHCWTMSQLDSTYRQREVIFADDRVIEVIAGPWID